MNGVDITDLASSAAAESCVTIQNTGTAATGENLASTKSVVFATWQFRLNNRPCLDTTFLYINHLSALLGIVLCKVVRILFTFMFGRAKYTIYTYPAYGGSVYFGTNFE